MTSRVENVEDTGDSDDNVAVEKAHEILTPTVYNFHDADLDKKSCFCISGSDSVRVQLSAERLTKKYPSTEMLVCGKGKKAFIFSNHREDDSRVIFGSKEGEYCLLRIRIMNVSDAHPIPIDNVADVQMLYQCGMTVNLKSAVTQSSTSYDKEVIALLEPEYLKWRIAGRPISDMENACKQDMRFQLHIQLTLADSQTRLNISKIVHWRTVLPMKSKFSELGKTLRQNALNKISSIKQRSVQAHKRRRQRHSSLDVTWRAFFHFTCQQSA